MSTKFGRRRQLMIVLAVLTSLILMTSLAYAEWGLTNVLKSWDTGASRWEPGNANMYLDGNPQPFYHEIVARNGDEFNNDLVSNACGSGTSTKWAGTAEIGLYHTDNAPDGAPGFQSTASYQLVSCDLDSNSPGGDSETPNTVLANCTVDDNNGVMGPCEYASKDTVVACSTGNCKNEIVTQISINLDQNCDGQIDSIFEDDVCLYWTAEKPPFQAPFWNGNFQGRISDGGGDKTINFKILGPNAITMSNIAASDALQFPITIAVLFFFAVIGTSYIVLHRRRLAKQQ